MEFVIFEVAKKLKEKGFDWETSNIYERNTLACRYEDYPKPTISQVLKWLREEKKIFVVIAVNPTLATKDKMAYYYQVYSNSDGVTSDYYESEDNFLELDNCGDVCDDKCFIERAYAAGAEYGYNLALEKSIDWFVKNWRNYLVRDKYKVIGLIGWQWDIKEDLKL